MTYKYWKDKASGLILVNAKIDHKYEVSMILDTGATHTTIDSNALHLLGYDLKDSLGIVEIETANGIIKTDVFQLERFTLFQITKEKFQVQVYDFLGHGIFSDYEGLIGMDFWEGHKFCIDTVNDVISI